MLMPNQAPNQTSRMPVARGDIAASLQLRRAPVLPMTLRQPSARVLQISHAPRQLPLFPLMKPTRPVDVETDTDFDAL
ncbi:MAG TPA: hypothetical protein VGM74_09630 [Burkholderiaceae bacterium]|jgi:hypothetical protein